MSRAATITVNRKGIQRTASRWTRNGYSPLAPSRFVKFVHFHSAILSGLPQGVSGGGHLQVQGQGSSLGFGHGDISPHCLDAGSSSLDSSAPRRARAHDS